MLASLRTRFTFANVCSFLALLIALGTGSAYAANTMFSTDIVDGEVKAADIATTPSAPARSATGTSATRTSAPTRSTARRCSTPRSPTPSSPTKPSTRPACSTSRSPRATSRPTRSTSTEIADNSIDDGEVSDNSLFAVELAAGSVRHRARSWTATVGNADLADNAVNGAKVAEQFDHVLRHRRRGHRPASFSLSRASPNSRCSRSPWASAAPQVGDRCPLIATNARSRTASSSTRCACEAAAARWKPPSATSPGRR